MGCTVPVTKEELIPKQVDSFEITGKTITVLPVVIKPQPELGLFAPSISMPDSNMYQDVITKTLINSKLFNNVSTEGKSDYILSSTVVGERLIGSFHNVGLFLIRYKLTDEKTGTTVWNDNIFSFSSISCKEIYYGEERCAKVVETGVRDNMKQLTNKLAEILLH
jgi:hypothetical protein